MRDPVRELTQESKGFAEQVQVMVKLSATAAMHCGERDLRWIERIHKAGSDLHFAVTCWYSLTNDVTSTEGKPPP